jgi:hypothetical protein
VLQEAAGAAALAQFPSGVSDTILGYFGSTAASALAINNCSNALTYSTSAHTFGCNTSGGTGTVITSGTPSANQTAVFSGAVAIGGVGPGTLGQQLTSNGPSAMPSFQTGVTLTSGPGITVGTAPGYVVSQSLNNAVLQASPANPTGTTSETLLMMGLGSTCKLTPVYSGRVILDFIGIASLTGSSTLNVGASYQVFFGTGTAPVNGAATTGTALGALKVVFVNSSAADEGSLPFSFGGRIQDLSVGTPVWFDIAVKSDNGGLAGVTNLDCSANEF